jgi:hypothetical protein
VDKDKFFDRILLTTDFYRKLTDDRIGLYFGILLVGIIDMIIPVIKKFKELFIGRPNDILFNNIALVIISVIVIGLVDVLFFSIPLFDFFKRFKSEEEVQSGGKQLIKIMKILVIANLLVFIPHFAVYLAYESINQYNHPLLVEILSILSIVIFIWYCAAITRGINSIYSFKPMFSKMLFMVVFFWNFILSNLSISYVIDNLIMEWFK